MCRAFPAKHDSIKCLINMHKESVTRVSMEIGFNLFVSFTKGFHCSSSLKLSNTFKSAFQYESYKSQSIKFHTGQWYLMKWFRFITKCSIKRCYKGHSALFILPIKGSLQKSVKKLIFVNFGWKKVFITQTLFTFLIF